jgi:hypothetical protein
MMSPPETLLNRLMTQMTECEGMTEALKAENQMLWVRRRSSVRHRSEEIVRQDFIY